MFTFTVTFGLLLVLLYFLYKNWNFYKVYWKKRGVEYTTTSGFISFMFSFKRFGDLDLILYNEVQSKGVKYIGGSEFGKPLLYVIDLDIIKKVLIKDFDSFINRREIKDIVDGPIKHMLTVLENQQWKNMRGTLSPAFSTGKIRRMFEIFDSVGTEFAAHLKTKGDKINFKDHMGLYSMNVVAGVVFGLKLDFDDNSKFVSTSRKFFKPSYTRIIKFLFATLFPKIASLIKMRFFEKEFDDFFSGVVLEAMKHRQAHPDVKWNDFLELLLETRAGKIENDPNDKEEKEMQEVFKGKVVMNDEMIIGNSILFLAAGFDTTETALLWAVYELSRNPHVQEKLYNEIDRVYERDGKLTYDAVNTMSYLDNFVSEVLRRHPPGARTERRTESDYVLEGENLTIEKGVLVQIPVYSIHHDPQFWDEPFTFNPERFNADIKGKRNPYAYMPFGHGPRNCIGMRFALIQVKVAIVHLVKNFNLTPSSSAPAEMKEGKLEMKPQGALEINIERRS